MEIFCKTNLFGSSLINVGSESSDLTLKTRGKVKIQIGNKFIDLIKNGKINTSFDFIYKVKSKDDIKSTDGIYIIQEEDPSVWLVSGNTKINLSGEIGNTYVSFLGDLKTTSELKKTALTNIGFLYESLEDIDSNSILNGIIYVEDKHKLYTIIDGNLSEFELDISNPYPKLFIVSKNDRTTGAIIIKGSTKENSLAFDKLYIYNLEEDSVIDSLGDLIINISGNQIVRFKQGLTIFSGNVNVNNLESSSISSGKIVTNRLESLGASINNGFRLYTESGKSTLEIDKVVERSRSDKYTFFYPEYWLYSNNVVRNAEYYTEPYSDLEILENMEILSIESEDGLYEDIVVYLDEFILTLNLKNEFKVGDVLFFYNKEEYLSSSETLTLISLVKLKVELILSNLTILVSSSVVDLSKTLLSNFIGEIVYLVRREGQLPIRIKDNNIDIIEYPDWEDEEHTSDPPTIGSRIGDISSVVLNFPEGRKKYGIYSNNVIFKNILLTGENETELPRYSDTLNTFLNTLPSDDLDNVVPTIQYIKKLISNIVPTGIISMWTGSVIPEGWIICDGSNGTPDLTDKFISSTSLQNTEEQSNDNQINNYSLVYIMKL